MEKKIIVLTGGGTLGHVTPPQAAARWDMSRRTWR